MMRTFQYQGLARALTASVAGFGAHLVSEPAGAEPLPLRSRRTTTWADLISVQHMSGIPPADPSRALRYPTAPPLPITIRRFHAEHCPIVSRDGVGFATMPAPQRAYTEWTAPNPKARRFAADIDAPAPGFPIYTLPIPTRAVGGNDPLPVRSPRAGAAHAPATFNVSPAALPIPTRAYLPTEQPVPRRRSPLPELSEAVKYKTTVGPITFLPQEHQAALERKRKPTHEGTTFRIDAGTPAFCWSQSAEYVRGAGVKLAALEPVTVPYANPDKSPAWFGKPTEPPPVRVKQRVTPEQLLPTPTTRNELTYPGSWSFDVAPPRPRRAAAPAWLMSPVLVSQSGGSTPDVPDPTLRACRFINLTGTDNTDIALTGDSSAATRQVNLTGVDNTDIGLTGEC